MVVNETASPTYLAISESVSETMFSGQSAALGTGYARLRDSLFLANCRRYAPQVGGDPADEGYYGHTSPGARGWPPDRRHCWRGQQIARQFGWCAPRGRCGRYVHRPSAALRGLAHHDQGALNTP